MKRIEALDRSMSTIKEFTENESLRKMIKELDRTKVKRKLTASISEETFDRLVHYSYEDMAQEESNKKMTK